MRRVLRHLFTVCSALSLLLCIACVLWVRSYRTPEYVQRDRADPAHRAWDRWELWSQRGSLRLARDRYRKVPVDEDLTQWPQGWRLGVADPGETLLERWRSLEGTGTRPANSPGESGFR